MEIKGILKKVNPTVTRGNFESRKVWITTETDTQYPQTLELEAAGKNVGIFSNISVGSGIICHINLRGREWANPNKNNEVSVFNTISVWKVETIAGSAKPLAVSADSNNDDINDDSTGDLPF